ncbi:isoniazid-induced protein IniB-like [Mytilus edulis]|uniref:isoniazid-induced protein IniB-like n=1 Tax=Mytilus edulis TaxID=6550 RepID=UPI0039EF272B
MMMNSCITCFALLLAISLTHASGVFGGSGGAASLARRNVGVELIGGTGISATLTGSGASQSITLSINAYLRLIYYVSALEKVCYNAIQGGWMPRGLVGVLGSRFTGQLGGGIAGQLGGFGGLGSGFTGQLGGGIAGQLGGFGGLGSGFTGQLGGGIAGQLGGFGGLGVGGLTGSLGGGISGGFGSGFAGRASGFGSSSLSGSLQGNLRAGLSSGAIGKGAAY